ncbi:MAG: PaaI family thioesterase, partial [Pseudomonadota bacterium]
MSDTPGDPAADPPPDPPAGFERHFRRSAVTDPWEPLWSRRAAPTAAAAPTGDAPLPLQLGVRLGPRHCNSRGFVHGAVIAALADNAMGLTYVLASREAGRDLSGAVTVSLNIDYAATARAGQWLQVEPRLIRAGGAMGFVDALVT